MKATVAKIPYPQEDCKHNECICACGLSAGQMQLRGGLLVRVCLDGNIILRAPRRTDVHLAQRVVAAVEGAKEDDDPFYFPANITGIGKK